MQVYFVLHASENRLVIRAKRENSEDILELISHPRLFGDLPTLLVEGHAHWPISTRIQMVLKPDARGSSCNQLPDNPFLEVWPGCCGWGLNRSVGVCLAALAHRGSRVWVRGGRRLRYGYIHGITSTQPSPHFRTGHEHEVGEVEGLTQLLSKPLSCVQPSRRAHE